MNNDKILNFIEHTVNNDFHFENADLKDFSLADMQELFSLAMIRVESREINLKNLVNTLEEKVKERTRELEENNSKLESTNVELQKSLEKVKLLSGLLPICASCKKVRDDKGYWQAVEEYVTEHSEAVFSHGFCPECLKELYPDFYKKMKAENRI